MLFENRNIVKREGLYVKFIVMLLVIFLFLGMFLSFYMETAYAEEPSGLFAGKYGKAQIFDVQRSPAYPTANQTFTLSDFKNIYIASEGFVSVDWGPNNDRYVQFIDSEPQLSGKEPAAYTVSLNLYEADGTLVKIISDYGTVWGLGEEGFFYEGHDFFGYFISNKEGFAYGSSLTYTPLTGLVTDVADLNTYSATTTVLGEGETAPSAVTTIVRTVSSIVYSADNDGDDYKGDEELGSAYTGNSVTVRIGSTVGQLKQAIAATDSSNQSYSVADINNVAKGDLDTLAIGDKLMVTAENGQDTATYKVWTTIAIEELADWNLVETMYDTAFTDPDDDLGSGGTNELVKLFVANDEEQLFFKVDVKDFYNGKSNLGLALSTSADGSTLDGMVWLEFDVRKSDNQILVTKATVDKIDGNQAAPTNFYSSDRIHISPSIQQLGTTSVVVKVPFSVFSQANLAGVNNNNIVPIWAQSNASQQSTAQWKDKIPDQGFFNYNTSGGTWQQETGLDPTTNMSFNLSQPDKMLDGNVLLVTLNETRKHI